MVLWRVEDKHELGDGVAVRILITGGAGFIASNVADEYIRLGHEVAVMDNLNSGLKKNVNPKAAFYKADISNLNEVTSAINDFKPDVINHHAAQIDVRVSTNEPHLDATINVIGSLNLIDTGVKHGVKKFIYASTGGAVYGEPEYLPVKETHPINPLSQYGISKHTVEHYLYLYKHNYGLDYTALRYPNVYGPRQNPHGEAGVIAIFAKKLLAGERPVIFGDGKQTRDYVFVSDVVQANVLALTKGSGEIINIGSGVETSVIELLHLLIDVSENRVEPIFAEPRIGEVQAISLDPSKAKEILNWSIEVPLKEGLRRTFKWIQSEQNT